MISLRFIALAFGLAVLIGAQIGRGDVLDFRQREMPALNPGPESFPAALQISSLNYLPPSDLNPKIEDVQPFVSPIGMVRDLTTEADPRMAEINRFLSKGHLPGVRGDGRELISDHPREFRPDFWGGRTPDEAQPMTAAQVETSDLATSHVDRGVDPMIVVVPAVVAAVTVSQVALHGKHRSRPSKPASHHSSRNVSRGDDNDDDSWVGILISFIFDAITNSDGGDRRDSRHHDTTHERRGIGHEVKTPVPHRSGTQGK